MVISFEGIHYLSSLLLELVAVKNHTIYVHTQFNFLGKLVTGFYVVDEYQDFAARKEMF